jgi:magnesium-transporting ATPase (P-type)
MPLEFNYIPQFAYPPWFALSTFFLGLFSIQYAATLWFEINMLIIFASVWLLTDAWSSRYRLIAFPAAFIFFPVMGTLAIGQYDFPVLLGASLLIYAIKNERPVLTALGMAFLTFKPHIGGLVLLAGLVYLSLRRDRFSRKALVSILGAGILLFGVGFLADSTWPISYIHSLVDYSDLHHITSCSECANLSVWLSRCLLDGSLASAALIAAALLTLFVALFFWFRKSLLRSHELFLNAAVLVTLLVSPYLYNYDYILLLVPFAFLVFPGGRIVDRIVVALAYFSPLVFIAMFGRDGNVSLLVSTFAVSILVFQRIRSFATVQTEAK